MLSVFVQLSGEDRWLCTLLLQQGYRVDYSAAADALTHCPETFDEFFRQRRRWIPSTLANIWDLLSDFNNIVLINDNISRLFMTYQAILMLSTVLGPATIIITIATAFQTVLGLDNYLWGAYALSLLIPAIYLAVCFLCDEKTQLVTAGLFSMIYAAVMTIVLVGLIMSLSTSSVLNPGLFFLASVVASFVLAGFLHPYEFFCLLHGALFFICIPTSYVLLMIYSLSNMHDISWGTREVSSQKSQKQPGDDANKPKGERKRNGFFGCVKRNIENSPFDIKKLITDAFQVTHQGRNSNKKVVKMLKRIHSQLKRLNHTSAGSSTDTASDLESDNELLDKILPALEHMEKKNQEPPPAATRPVEHREKLPPADPDRLRWIHDPVLGDGAVMKIDEKETVFWNNLVRMYLKPLKSDRRQKEKVEKDLISLRNSISFGFWMVNVIWVLLNFMLQTRVNLINLYQNGDGTWIKCQPNSFVYVVFYIFVLGLQVFGMLLHR